MLCVLWAGPAQAQGPLERAREELGIERPLPTRWPLPNGDLEVGPAELIGGGTVRFTVRLERPEPGGALYVGLPGTRRGRSGLPGMRGPSRLAIRFRGRALEHAAEAEHVGLAAGTYALPLTWHDGRPAGHARLRVLAAVREGRTTPWRGTNVSLDAAEQSEAFSAVVPGDPRRIVTAANPGHVEPTMSAWRSQDGGASWTRHPLPEALDVPGSPAPEPASVCCDPMLAATPSGDVWVGGITDREGPAGSRSRVVVNRLPGAGRDTFAPLTVGLPARTFGAQDKPMITAAPDGRLLVVWLEPDAQDPAALNVVMSACHTGLGPREDPGAWCEEADHWTEPVEVTPRPGSYTYPDVAAAADGTVHVTWWDYSATENAVRGATCAASCQGTFTTPRTIALLDATGGRPLPYGCPIPVAPGGRAGAVPSVEAAPGGRVWVAWADLRPGSGTTRCEATRTGGFTPPRATHLSWDAYAATAVGGLPGGTVPSLQAGTPLITDGDEGVATSSDEFLPWLAVDPVYGEAWASAYSTGHDPARASAHYTVMSLAPGAPVRVGPANRVSAAPSGFAGSPCCSFGNDFGDYAGLAATDRVVVPAWIDNATGGDAELWAAAGPLPTVAFDLVSVERSEGPDGRVLLRPTVRNTGTRTATGFTTTGPSGALDALPEGATATRGRVTWPPLPPGAAAVAGEPLEIVLADGFDCTRPLTARLTVGSPDGTEALVLSVPLACDLPPSPPDAPTAPSTQIPNPPPARALTAFGVVPGQRLATVLRRGLLVSARCARECRATVSADLGRGFARRLALRRRVGFAAATFGTATRRVRVPVRARARRLLRRRSVVRLRVRAFTGTSRRTRHVTLRR